MAASSPQELLALPAPLNPSSAASRRLPPPCWSHDETVALIDSYRDKWYSLRRGNLRATHWQEVADNVAAVCPVSSGNPTKTSVQCRHKMEKLRKRYRAELQRALTTPKGHRFSSSWVHFKRMDAMEKGSSAAAAEDPISVSRHANDEENEDVEEDDEEEDEDLYQSVKKSFVDRSSGNGIGSRRAFRIRIPGRTLPGTKIQNKFDGRSYPQFDYIQNPVSTRVVRDGYSLGFGKRGGGGGVGNKRERDPVAEIVAAIKALGDGFVRMERMKMEVAKEVENMRMEMEMKRTEMILESQQRIVEAFAKHSSEKRTKKVKRMATPES
ncbi:hypothetical protein U1Q18_035987 [Sarracenia purpurea var. burkii]